MLNIGIYELDETQKATQTMFGYPFINIRIGHAKQILEHEAEKLELIPKKWERIKAGHYVQTLRHPETDVAYRLQITRHF